MKLRLPDMIRIYGENWTKEFDCEYVDGSGFHIDFDDVDIDLEKKESLEVRVKAQTTPLNFIRLRYNFTEEEKRKDIIKIWETPLKEVTVNLNGSESNPKELFRGICSSPTEVTLTSIAAEDSPKVLV